MGNKESTFQTILNTIVSIGSIAIVLFGTASGWGTIKSKIGSLEDRLSRIEKDIEKLEESRLSKEAFEYFKLEIQKDHEVQRNQIQDLSRSFINSR